MSQEKQPARKNKPALKKAKGEQGVPPTGAKKELKTAARKSAKKAAK
jgi:hypothetical protein